MTAGPGQLGPHGQPVRVVAGHELADEQRRLGILGRGVREAIAQVGEGRVKDPPDLDRVDRPRRDHGLVDRRSVALDDDLPEAQPEAADRQIDTAAKLAGDDGVTVDPASDQRVERLVAATLVHPVECHQDPAVARQAVGPQHPDGRHHRRIGAFHVGRPAADEQVAIPLRRGVLDVDGIEMAVPLDGRTVAGAELGDDRRAARELPIDPDGRPRLRQFRGHPLGHLGLVTGGTPDPQQVEGQIGDRFRIDPTAGLAQVVETHGPASPTAAVAARARFGVLRPASIAGTSRTWRRASVAATSGSPSRSASTSTRCDVAAFFRK